MSKKNVIPGKRNKRYASEKKEIIWYSLKISWWGIQALLFRLKVRILYTIISRAIGRPRKDGLFLTSYSKCESLHTKVIVVSTHKCGT